MTGPHEQACARSVRVHLTALRELASTLEHHESWPFLAGACRLLDSAAGTLSDAAKAGDCAACGDPVLYHPEKIGEYMHECMECDECNGSGYYLIDEEPQECVCWPETLLGSMCVACGAEP